MIVANPSAVRAISEGMIKTDTAPDACLFVAVDPSELYVPSEEVRAKTISRLLKENV